MNYVSGMTVQGRKKRGNGKKKLWSRNHLSSIICYLLRCLHFTMGISCIAICITRANQITGCEFMLLV